jgi:hypothetical protein
LLFKLNFCTNYPEDPVAFIADYLRRVLSGASSVSRAYQYITLSPHHRQAFMDNAVVAFSVLDAGEEGRGVVGIERGCFCCCIVLVGAHHFLVMKLGLFNISNNTTHNNGPGTHTPDGPCAPARAD